MFGDAWEEWFLRIWWILKIKMKCRVIFRYNQFKMTIYLRLIFIAWKQLFLVAFLICGCLRIYLARSGLSTRIATNFCNFFLKRRPEQVLSELLLYFLCEFIKRIWGIGLCFTGLLSILSAPNTLSRPFGACLIILTLPGTTFVHFWVTEIGFFSFLIGHFIYFLNYFNKFVVLKLKFYFFSRISNNKSVSKN